MIDWLGVFGVKWLFLFIFKYLNNDFSIILEIKKKKKKKKGVDI